MTKYNVLDQENNVVEFNTKKAVAEFLAEKGVKGTVKTIEKHVSKALDTDGQYENFTIKTEEENEMENLKNTAAEVNENSQEDVVYDNPADDQNFENLEVPEFEAQPTAETETTESEVETEKPAEETVPEVEPADEMTEEEIQKAQDENVEPESKKDEEKKENKRRVGKGIIAYKNGEELEAFPSIKATAQYFKDLLELNHMPYTPIMKSVRQGIDWNEYSFKHENDADLHIPESLKKKIEESKQKQSEEQAKQDTPAAESKEIKDDVIEEITEEITEETAEPVAETK